LRNLVVVGAQWGDEGKGKVVDLLAPHYQTVVRFQGGNNAGHSVEFDGRRFALHLLPSGIFHQGSVNLIAGGVVVDPIALASEIQSFRDKGIEITASNLKISDRAHILMPYHGIIDRFRDKAPDRRTIGTTGRGIGPAYEWKAKRRGIRFCDLEDEIRFEHLLRNELEMLLHRYSDIPAIAELTYPGLRALLDAPLDLLRAHIVDGVTFLAERVEQESGILFEGAQACLLDVDLGTYPYVTSSNSCAAGVPAGAGVPANALHSVLGVTKAYASRVGEGPFPTELSGDIGEQLQTSGKEFGTTTGRPRRCGWLDLVALKFACRVNGFSSIALMKLDVLDGFQEVQLCYGYDHNGQTTDNFPASLAQLERARPLYRSFEGWQQPLHQARHWADLPQNARRYLDHICDYLGCPIDLVSVGPDREQTLIRPGGLLDF